MSRIPERMLWVIAIVFPFGLGLIYGEPLWRFGRRIVPTHEREMVVTKDLRFADYPFVGMLPALQRCEPESGGLLAGTPVRVRQLGCQFNLHVAGQITGRGSSDVYFGVPVKLFGDGSPGRYYSLCDSPGNPRP